jgi:hypothetical protein
MPQYVVAVDGVWVPSGRSDRLAKVGEVVDLTIDQASYLLLLSQVVPATPGTYPSLGTYLDGDVVTIRRDATTIVVPAAQLAAFFSTVPSPLGSVLDFVNARNSGLLPSL